MKFDSWLLVFGDLHFRGDCFEEEKEQIIFFDWLKLNHADYARLLIHPKIEGKRSFFMQMKDRKTGAMNKGVSDIVIPCSPAFICEIKRKNHIKSKWQDGQKEFLSMAKNKGSFVCVALGADAAKEAFNYYLESIKK